MIEEICSLKNRLVKMAISLKQKKYRDELGMFVAEGIRLAEEAVKSDWELVCAFCTDKSLANERVMAVLAELERKNIAVYKLKRELYDKLSDTEAPQGLMVIVRKRLVGEADLLRGDRPLLIVLDGVQDPGNVGTIIRTAEAAGCAGIIMLKGTADLYSGKVVRATMGSLFRLPIISQADRSALLAFAGERGFNLIAAALDENAKVCYDFDFTAPSLLVFGNEGNGVSPELLAVAAEKLYIPMQGEAESLNVATAATVVIYEALRQRCYKNVLS